MGNKKWNREALADAMKLYAVTDRYWLNGRHLEDDVEEGLSGGVTFLQLREKNLSETEFLKQAITLKKLSDCYQIPFVINDHVGIAKASNADGVHIGQSDMGLVKAREELGKEKIIGVSVQTVKQAKEAEENGADYLGVGAVFPTGTKLDAEDVSYVTLKAIVDSVNIPVVAIGGIHKDNLYKLKGTGIDGVAVVSAIFGKDNIKNASIVLKKEVEKQLINGDEKDMSSKSMKKVLTIAGSDSSGGAGIQADLKTMCAHGVYGMSAITALTAQNTSGVYGVVEVEADFVANEIDCVFTDIRPDAVKIGMVSSSHIIRSIANKLNEYEAENIVVDPVMVATSGSPLISEEAMQTLIDILLPLGKVITPNIPEAEKLCGFKIRSEEEMLMAAEEIQGKLVKKNPGFEGAILIKGGHFGENANDLLFTDGEARWFGSPRYNNSNTHGTGCTLSSAIASNLAKGLSVIESVALAKQYIAGAIQDGLDIGKGRGPLNHLYRM
jgi:hydroxymethylpyrimidine kinase/phosphomethylpyrimidine kinase/thiamine-phosphate diphosphorylase